MYSNTTAAAHELDPDALRVTLADQLASPVRFVEMIEAMYEAGARRFVEVGPGSVLTGLVGRILGERPHLAVSLDRKGRDGIDSLFAGLGRLAASGVGLDFAPLWSGFRGAGESGGSTAAEGDDPAERFQLWQALSSRRRRGRAAAAESSQGEPGRGVASDGVRTLSGGAGCRSCGSDGSGRSGRGQCSGDGGSGLGRRISGGAATDRGGAHRLRAGDGADAHRLPRLH